MAVSGDVQWFLSTVEGKIHSVGISAHVIIIRPKACGKINNEAYLFLN